MREAVEDNPLAKAVGVMAERGERWARAAGALLPLLDARMNEAAKKHRSHPSTPAALGKALVRLAPDLRQVGVDVRRHRTGQDRDRGARTARPRGRGAKSLEPPTRGPVCKSNFCASAIKEGGYWCVL